MDVKLTTGTSTDEASEEVKLCLALENNDISSTNKDDIEEITPVAENPDNQWFKNCHASMDLDEKFSTMTGSYSEILEELSTVEESKEIIESTKVEELSNIDKEISPHDNISVSIPDQTNFFNDGPISVPWYESTSRNLHSLPAPLHSLYLEPPLIDPNALTDIEEFACHIATSMDSLTENLTDILHGISALSVDCVETYRDAVCKTCDAVDANIKSMYQLMAKCEELSKAMKPMYKLQDQLKDIRRLLDMFESAVYSGGV